MASQNRLRSFFATVTRKLRQPKWRHGRWSLLALSAMIATCVLLNVGVAALEREYGWRKDYSFNGYASTGAETKAALSRLENPVELYLLYQGGQMDSQMLELLYRYDALSDLIQVLPTDIAKNPGIFNRFQGDLERALEVDTVIVNCGATERYRVLTYADFIAQGYNIDEGTFEIAGLAYEKRLTEAIVYVAEDSIPVVGLLQGHGELTPEDLQVFTGFLRSNNYDSRPVNLLRGDSLEGIDLLLVASPQKDVTDGELQSLSSFAQEGGNFLVLRDFTDPMSLPNYFSLLLNYGVQPLAGYVIAGEEDAGSYFDERVYLLPYMCELDMTLPLIANGLDSLLMVDATAFEAPREPDSRLTTATVLKSGPNAYLREDPSGSAGIDRLPGERVGEFSLALFAHRMHPSGNVSRMFALGNSSLLALEYFYQIPFTEEFIIQVMNELLPQKTVSLDIMVPAAFPPRLRASSPAAGAVLLAVPPFLLLAVALFVLLPRRNR